MTVRGRLALVAVGVALVLTIPILYTSWSSPDGMIRHVSIDQLRAFLDRAPLPPESRLVDEQSSPGHADAVTYLSRSYQTPVGASTCIQVVTTMAAAGWKLSTALGTVEPATCAVDPDETMATAWPPGGARGSIYVSWTERRFTLAVSESNSG